jgi:hypothetical protein
VSEIGGDEWHVVKPVFGETRLPRRGSRKLAGDVSHQGSVSSRNEPRQGRRIGLRAWYRYLLPPLPGRIPFCRCTSGDSRHRLISNCPAGTEENEIGLRFNYVPFGGGHFCPLADARRTKQCEAHLFNFPSAGQTKMSAPLIDTPCHCPPLSATPAIDSFALVSRHIGEYLDLRSVRLSQGLA